MDHPKIVLACVIVVLAALSGLAMVPAIDRWERQAGYPYGKMCNSIFTGYVDTCRR